ncbi:hypothetical protein Aduo_018293 [Ancylostoma duodenale]
MSSVGLLPERNEELKELLEVELAEKRELSEEIGVLKSALARSSIFSPPQLEIVQFRDLVNLCNAVRHSDYRTLDRFIHDWLLYLLRHDSFISFSENFSCTKQRIRGPRSRTVQMISGRYYSSYRTPSTNVRKVAPVHVFECKLWKPAHNDYNIIAFDVEAPGRAGDAGVFCDSNIERWIAQNEQLFPETRELGSVGPVQYHFLVNSGFDQDFRLTRHSNQGDGNESRILFSWCPTDDRVLFCRRFVVLQKPIELIPIKVSRMVISLMILHNSRRADVLQDMERYSA